jgi:ATP-dependent exoDNAse (exonuclease V) alpha subunit
MGWFTKSRSKEVVEKTAVPVPADEEVAESELSEEQQKLFTILETTNENAYITGRACTGKSFLLEHFTKHTSKTVVVVAPTGVAALNVGGQTIHSFFKLPPEVIDPKDVRIDYKTKEILKHVDAIVIDEVSMVRVDLMEAINIKLQLARKNKLPFGGIQMIMFGDLYQLAPVVSDGQMHRYFDDTYGGVYFFNAHVYKEQPIKIYELGHIFRQTDPAFREILSTIRSGKNMEPALEKINERFGVGEPDTAFVTLAGTNNTVHGINREKLESLTTEAKSYEAEITGDITEASFPTEKKLVLKVGAQVMLIKNDQKKPGRWVNGTLGVITKLGPDSIRVNVNGVEHSVSKETWEKIKYVYDEEEQQLEKETVSSFTQFPIRLAWAITIHKSQGKTYDTVAIDLSDGAFAHGQTYVALSRCRSLEGIYLQSTIRPQDVIVDQDVVAFMSKAETIST